jgi:methyl coenzyme M reductase subunit D
MRDTITFKHPTVNSIGCAKLIESIGVDRIKIISLTELVKPKNIFINLKFESISDTSSSTLPVSYDRLQKEFIQDGKQFLLYKKQSNIWISLGVMKGNQFVEISNENKNLNEIQEIQPFEFKIEFEFIC